MERKTFQECALICHKRGWSAMPSKGGLWVVGPEIGDGVISVIAFGVSFEDAVQKAEAKISQKSQDPETGK